MKPATADYLLAGRFLDGISVGLSVSCGEDSANRGFTENEMNRSVVRLADGLLAVGARLVFGHDWRPRGVMAAIADLAIRYEPSTSPSGSNGIAGTCRITNLVPWDRRAELPEDLRNDLEARGILRIEEILLPESLAQREQQLGKRTLRAASLSLLRQRLTDLCDARICLGGKFREYRGFWPGIFEEAWIGAMRRQPIFLSDMLGGAASRLLEASHTDQWDTLTAPGPDDELRRGLALLRESGAMLMPDSRQLREVMSWHQLQRTSGLGREDWQRLNEATDIQVITALVLKGLRQIRESPGWLARHSVGH